MPTDVILFSTPNKNIDYPGLSLPMLTAALRQKGFNVEQFDLNVTLRNRLLSESHLADLINKTIPFIATIISNDEYHILKLYELYSFLNHLKNTKGLKLIEQVKLKAQARDYRWIFNDENNFLAYMDIFKINRSLHYIIDLLVNYIDELPSDKVTGELQNILAEAKAIVDSKKPKVVGFSILDIQRIFSLKLINILRAEFPGLIAVGGADPTRFPREYLLYYADIDLVFYREAEEALPKLLEALNKKHKTFEEVPSIFYRDSSKNIVGNHSKPVDLSCLPTPDFRGLPLDYYLTPALPIQASRGCYWHKCTFCIHWDTYCDFRVREPLKVISDIKTLESRHNTKYFHFTDDCIPVPLARELVDKMIENKLNVSWLAYFRFENSLDQELLIKIYNAGGRVLEMGLESASENVLKMMNKNISVPVAQRILNDGASAGLLIKMFMFHGYPGENHDDIKKTIEFTERHITCGRARAFLPLRNRFEILRGSEIYESAKNGKETNIMRFWESSGIFGIRGEYILKNEEKLTRDAILKFVDRMRLYMRNNNIYNTNDENVMVDLLVLDYAPLPCGWRCR